MKFSKNWLQSYIKDALPANEVIVDGLSKKAFEVEDVSEYIGYTSGTKDSVLEIKILPNRAHDCLGHLGLARELATIFNLELQEEAKYTWGNPAKNKDLEFLIQKYKTQTSIPVKKQVFVEDVRACTRLATMQIDGIKVGESPTWLRERLEAIGQRSINNIVDITNYVQFSINKPMHAYDAANITGRLCAVFANEGEVLTTLDDKELILDKETLIIADEGDAESGHSKALGLAGIKGGKFSGISNQTSTVVLESANFNPDLTRKTSQKYNIRTDASKRFENGVADSLIADGLYMTARMILEIAGNSNTVISEIEDTKKTSDRFNKVITSFTEINRVAGKIIENNKIISILESLGLLVIVDNDNLSVIIPPERLDLEIADDIAEEVVRIYGFDNIESRAINLSSKGKVHTKLAIETEIKKLLLEKGFSEVFDYAFTDRGEVEIALPLASDKSHLRISLVQGAIKAFEKNKALTPLLETELLQFFEFGNVFIDQKEERRCVLVKDDGKKKTNYTKDLENILEEIKTHFKLENLNKINKIDKPASIEFSIEEIVNGVEKSILASLQNNFVKADYALPKHKYTPFSIYPFIARDVSMWIPNSVNFADIGSDIKNLNLNNFNKIYLFDSYAPKDEENVNFGKTSIAFRIIFQSYEKTLTAEEVEVEMQKVHEFLKTKDFEVR